MTTTNDTTTSGKAILTFTTTTAIDVPSKRSIEELIIDVDATIKYRIDGDIKWKTCDTAKFVDSQHLNLVFMDEHNNIVSTQNIPGCVVVKNQPKSVGTSTADLEACSCITCAFLRRKYNELEHVDENSKFDLNTDPILTADMIKQEPIVIDVNNDSDDDVLIIEQIKTEPDVIVVQDEPNIVHWDDTVQEATKRWNSVKQTVKRCWQDRLDGLHHQITTTDNSKSWKNRIEQVRKHNRIATQNDRDVYKYLRRSARIAAQKE